MTWRCPGDLDGPYLGPEAFFLVSGLLTVPGQCPFIKLLQLGCTAVCLTSPLSSSKCLPTVPGQSSDPGCWSGQAQLIPLCLALHGALEASVSLLGSQGRQIQSTWAEGAQGQFPWGRGW